jgi:hypothetical protein
MNRSTVLGATLAALLTLVGCNTSTQSAPLGKTFTPIPVHTVTPTDAQKKADEKLWRDVEEKKRKSKSANLNKTKAYQNYIP